MLELKEEKRIADENKKKEAAKKEKQAKETYFSRKPRSVVMTKM